MSGTAAGATSTGTNGGLYDQTGSPIRSGQAQQTVEPLVNFVQEQPVVAALVALGIGYLLGKMF